VIVLADPRVGSQQVSECGEPFVELQRLSSLLIDHRHADRDGFALVRREVARRLVAAQALLPRGIRVLVVEGYRHPDRQRAIFDRYRSDLESLHPDWDPKRLHSETSKFVSPVDVAPHCTGGAVDLTLCNEDGVELDMGTEIDASPEASGNACFTDAPSISAKARSNRRILVNALLGAGMVNYPTEWWHWSYGERYWSLISGAESAVYGPVGLDEARRGAPMNSIGSAVDA
jgi:D-alanyl-D-alanine dipeptidase